MPEQESKPGDDPAALENPAGAEKSSLFAKIKILLLVGVVVAVECLVAYLYLPSTSETAALASAALGNAETNAAEENEDEEEELVDQVEVDMGEFTVTAFQPISNTTLRIDFHLYGTVAAQDHDEFITLMEENLHRFREQVIVTVRSADITDLTDAGLGLVKRKILEKTNRTLGKSLLRVVIFSDFSFIEQ